MKKNKPSLKNNFYVASDSIHQRNDQWCKSTLDEAIEHAQMILAANPKQQVKYISKIVAKVEVRRTPVQVSLFE